MAGKVFRCVFKVELNGIDAGSKRPFNDLQMLEVQEFNNIIRAPCVILEVVHLVEFAVFDEKEVVGPVDIKGLLNQLAFIPFINITEVVVTVDHVFGLP